MVTLTALAQALLSATKKAMPIIYQPVALTMVTISIISPLLTAKKLDNPASQDFPPLCFLVSKLDTEIILQEIASSNSLPTILVSRTLILKVISIFLPLIFQIIIRKLPVLSLKLITLFIKPLLMVNKITLSSSMLMEPLL